MAHKFPTLYVREGIQDLAIPHCPGAFESDQRRPISDARKWIDQFFEANTKKTRSSGHGETAVVNLNPTLALGIISVRRELPQSRSPLSGWLETHEVASFARTAGPDLYPLLQIIKDRQLDVFEVTASDKTEVVACREERTAREIVQGALRPILAELGYGTPDEFEEKSMPLEMFWTERGIGPKEYQP